MSQALGQSLVPCVMGCALIDTRSSFASFEINPSTIESRFWGFLCWWYGREVLHRWSESGRWYVRRSNTPRAHSVMSGCQQKYACSGKGTDAFHTMLTATMQLRLWYHVLTRQILSCEVFKSAMPEQRLHSHFGINANRWAQLCLHLIG